MTPKKPPTAFFYYLEDFRKEFQEQNPHVKSMSEVGKACGEKWKTMTYEEKIQYYDIATEKRAKFEKDMMDYVKKKFCFSLRMRNNVTRILRLKKEILNKVTKRSRIKKPKTRDTLKFYRNQLGFEKPSTVLIDGSVLFYLTSRGLTIEAIRNLIDDSDAKPITTECVLREMEYFSERYSKSVSDLHRSIGLANMLDVESCMHEKEVNAEKCIRSFVGINNTRKIFVATTVNDYWPLVNKNPMIPIITVDNGSLVLKQRSNKEQNRTIKKWCVEYPIQQPDGITKKDLKKSPSYKRLKGRKKFYGYAGKIALGDGNGQVRAISEQLGAMEWPYQKVRECLVKQLLLHPELYQDHVSPPANADADLTYLEYIKITSRDGEWGDEYTLQVAADFFEVIIVVLTSDEQVAVNDYFPHGVDDHKQVLFLSCLDEKYYNSMRPKSSIASTCKYDYM
ncbi:high mobility group B protein 14 [Artemisia annua]|uniref:High mobility group B protein 14 n=1 Tax=Artemisia annua TaxID=35608 RepID=A0A2U1MQV0_ARTAN|nr:high mobility group B protein 14 [Artemisia annua]